jgi:hypothetical protein
MMIIVISLFNHADIVSYNWFAQWACKKLEIVWLQVRE